MDDPSLSGLGVSDSCIHCVSRQPAVPGAHHVGECVTCGSGFVRPGIGENRVCRHQSMYVANGYVQTLLLVCVNILQGFLK